jgi:hypothetical protein
MLYTTSVAEFYLTGDSINEVAKLGWKIPLGGSLIEPYAGEKKRDKSTKNQLSTCSVAMSRFGRSSCKIPFGRR